MPLQDKTAEELRAIAETVYLPIIQQEQFDLLSTISEGLKALVTAPCVEAKTLLTDCLALLDRKPAEISPLEYKNIAKKVNKLQQNLLANPSSLTVIDENGLAFLCAAKNAMESLSQLDTMRQWLNITAQILSKNLQDNPKKSKFLLTLIIKQMISDPIGKEKEQILRLASAIKPLKSTSPIPDTSKSPLLTYIEPLFSFLNTYDTLAPSDSNRFEQLSENAKNQVIETTFTLIKKLNSKLNDLKARGLIQENEWLRQTQEIEALCQNIELLKQGSRLIHSQAKKIALYEQVTKKLKELSEIEIAKNNTALIGLMSVTRSVASEIAYLDYYLELVGIGYRSFVKHQERYKNPFDAMVDAQKILSEQNKFSNKIVGFVDEKFNDILNAGAITLAKHNAENALQIFDRYEERLDATLATLPTSKRSDTFSRKSKRVDTIQSSKSAQEEARKIIQKQYAPVITVAIFDTLTKIAEGHLALARKGYPGAFTLITQVLNLMGEQFNVQKTLDESEQLKLMERYFSALKNPVFYQEKLDQFSQSAVVNLDGSGVNETEKSREIALKIKALSTENDGDALVALLAEAHQETLRARYAAIEQTLYANLAELAKQNSLENLYDTNILGFLSASMNALYALSSLKGSEKFLDFIAQLLLAKDKKASKNTQVIIKVILKAMIGNPLAAEKADLGRLVDHLTRIKHHHPSRTTEPMPENTQNKFTSALTTIYETLETVYQHLQTGNLTQYEQSIPGLLKTAENELFNIKFNIFQLVQSNLKRLSEKEQLKTKDWQEAYKTFEKLSIELQSLQETERHLLTKRNSFSALQRAELIKNYLAEKKRLYRDISTALASMLEFSTKNSPELLALTSTLKQALNEHSGIEYYLDITSVLEENLLGSSEPTSTEQEEGFLSTVTAPLKEVASRAAHNAARSQIQKKMMQSVGFFEAFTLTFEQERAPQPEPEKQEPLDFTKQVTLLDFLNLIDLETKKPVEIQQFIHEIEIYLSEVVEETTEDNEFYDAVETLAQESTPDNPPPTSWFSSLISNVSSLVDTGKKQIVDTLQSARDALFGSKDDLIESLQALEDSFSAFSTTTLRLLDLQGTTTELLEGLEKIAAEHHLLSSDLENLSTQKAKLKEKVDEIYLATVTILMNKFINQLDTAFLELITPPLDMDRIENLFKEFEKIYQFRNFPIDFDSIISQKLEKYLAVLTQLITNDSIFEKRPPEITHQIALATKLIHFLERHPIEEEQLKTKMEILEKRIDAVDDFALINDTFTDTIVGRLIQKYSHETTHLPILNLYLENSKVSKMLAQLNLLTNKPVTDFLHTICDEISSPDSTMTGLQKAAIFMGALTAIQSILQEKNNLEWLHIIENIKQLAFEEMERKYPEVYNTLKIKSEISFIRYVKENPKKFKTNFLKMVKPKNELFLQAHNAKLHQTSVVIQPDPHPPVHERH